MNRQRDTGGRKLSPFILFGALGLILFVLLALFVTRILLPVRERDAAAAKADKLHMDSVIRVRRKGDSARVGAGSHLR